MLDPNFVYNLFFCQWIQKHPTLVLTWFLLFLAGQTMLGQYVVLVTLYHGLQLVSSKTFRIGDTKYHIAGSKFF